MPAFAYQAVDSAGKQVGGEAEAPDVGTLTRTLEAKGLLVLEVETAARKMGGGARFQFGRRREVLEVTRAMASLLPSGLPLSKALGAASNVAGGAVAASLEAVRKRVERGEPLADALRESPEVFSPSYVGLVRAGEKSGDLVGAFKRLTVQLEREESLRAKLLSASLYPLLLMSLGGTAIVVLLIFVIPRFAALLEDSGSVLPTSTAVLLWVSNAVTEAWWVLALVPVVGVAGISWSRWTEEGRRLTTVVMLRIPFLRALVRNTLAAQFARMTGTLVSGGAPLVSGLDDAVESMSDPVVREDAIRIRARVREGSSLSQAIGEGSLFPQLLRQLVLVGEESSQLPEFLLKAAEIFEEKTERAMERLVIVAEPAMIVFFGSIVGFVALSLLQAIYGVNAGSFR